MMPVDAVVALRDNGWRAFVAELPEKMIMVAGITYHPEGKA